MILIGQYDSPFVRRVAIALHRYDIAYEHRPWSTFGDADRIAHYNPLRRVPTLVLDDGEVLVDSAAILDHLDEVAGPSKTLIARSGPARRQALKICALATGLADKAVSLVYERVLHQQVSQPWIDRCVSQIVGVQLREPQCQSFVAKRGRTWFHQFALRIQFNDLRVELVVGLGHGLIFRCSIFNVSPPVR